VHALPSLHEVPFAASGLEHPPVLGSHVPATWHWSLGLHCTGFEPTHAPALQTEVCMHLFVLSQPVPSGAIAGAPQVPVDGLQAPATRQGSSGKGQTTGFDPLQVPALHW
jgi:hypothetical protein